jgi:hypothetical protein
MNTNKNITKSINIINQKEYKVQIPNEKEFADKIDKILEDKNK